MIPLGILAWIAAQEAPVDGHDIDEALHLRAQWGARWRTRLGRLLRSYERSGRVRRAKARPWAGVPAGWEVVDG